MTRTGIDYDHDQVLSALTGAQAVTQRLAQAHAQARPALPETAAGRDFAATAARLQAAFDRVHQVGQRRIDALAASAAAGKTQINHLSTTDADTARSFQAGKE